MCLSGLDWNAYQALVASMDAGLGTDGHAAYVLPPCWISRPPAPLS